MKATLSDRIGPVIGLAILVACAAGIIITYRHHHAAATADKSELIARTLGGTSWCEQSTWKITNQFNNTETFIYQCKNANGRDLCVTYEDNVPTDQTALARMLFSNVLATDDRPWCLK